MRTIKCYMNEAVEITSAPKLDCSPCEGRGTVDIDPSIDPSIEFQYINRTGSLNDVSVGNLLPGEAPLLVDGFGDEEDSPHINDGIAIVGTNDEESPLSPHSDDGIVSAGPNDDAGESPHIDDGICIVGPNDDEGDSVVGDEGGDCGDSGDKELVHGDMEVAYPMFILDKQWFEKFEAWYDHQKDIAGKLVNDRRYLKNIPHVHKAKLDFFTNLWEPHGWLSDSNIDAIVGMLLLESKKNTAKFPKSWTTVNYAGWLALTSPNPDHAAKRLKPLVEGKYPRVGNSVSWANADKIVGIGLASKHWFCYEVKIEDQKVVVYDSLSMERRRTMTKSTFRSALRNLAEACKEGDVWKYKQRKGKLKDVWELDIYEHPPQQENSHDCGIFALKFMECLITGCDLRIIKQKHIPTWRQQYCASLYRLSEEAPSGL